MPNHLIPVTDAASLISTFGSEKENMLATNFQDNGTLPVCETFDRAAFDIILSDTACTGVRIYLGMDGNSKVRLIIVGVNSSEEDIVIPAESIANPSDVDCVVEDGTRCPTTCPPPSALNS